VRALADRSRAAGAVKRAANAVLAFVGAGDTLKGRFERR
jgi:hypothetical protein